MHLPFMECGVRLLLSAFCAQNMAEDVSILDILQARQSRLQNIIVHYHQQDHYTPGEDILESMQIANDKAGSPGGTTIALSGTISRNVTYKRYGNVIQIKKAWDHSELKGIGGPSDHVQRPENYLGVYHYLPDRVELLRQSRPDSTPTGMITYFTPMVPEDFVDCGLGLRLLTESDHRLGKVDYSALQFSQGDDEVLVAQYIDQLNMMNRWWFTKEMAMTRYSVQSMDNNYESIVIECDDFRNVSGIMLPYHLKRAHYHKRDENGEVRQAIQFEITVESYELDVFADDEDIAGIKWPEAIGIIDSRRGNDLIKHIRDGEFSVRDFVIPEEKPDDGSEVNESSLNFRDNTAADRDESVWGWRVPLLLGMLFSVLAFFSAIQEFRMKARRKNA